jgi:hypothetical protein
MTWLGSRRTAPGQPVVATLAARFRVRRTERTPPIPEPLLTLRPRGGLPARIERRRPGSG